MKKLKSKVISSALVLTQLGAVAIPISLITTQQTYAVKPLVKIAMDKVWPAVKSYLSWETVDYIANKCGVDVHAFYDEVLAKLKELGSKASAAYDKVKQMESDDALFFSDYEFASDLP